MKIAEKNIRWQIRVDEELQNEVVKYAEDKKWDLSFTVRELLRDQLKFLKNKTYYPKKIAHVIEEKVANNLTEKPAPITPLVDQESLDLFADFNQRRRNEFMTDEDWVKLRKEIEASPLSEKQKFVLTKKPV